MRNFGRRPAFTLVELLVVIAVMLVLMTLAVAFVPRVREQQRVSQAAASVQGWLAIAKQWALRDQAPRGVRLTPTAGNGAWVTTLQYIEQPDDWVGSPGSYLQTTSSVPPGSPYWTISLLNSTSDFSGGYGPPPSGQTVNYSWPVLPGDIVEIDSGYNAKLYPIVQPNTFRGIPSPFQGNATSCTTILIPSQITNPNIPGQGNYRIIRGPRVKEGEAPLQLQADVAIDLSTNAAPPLTPLPPSPPVAGYGGALPGTANAPGSVDIIFAPSGAVISPRLAGGDIRLWVIDTSRNSPPTPGVPSTFEGQQFIVSVAIRTGMISIKPVNTITTINGNGNTVYAAPYSYAQDGTIDGTLSGF
jgi:prepilin-type N-terminal cleavage/methylation domain-containing protein